MINNKVLLVFEEALVKYKEQIEEFEKTINILNKDIEANKDDISEFKDILEKQKAELTDKFNKLIDNVISKIPKTEKVDYARLDGVIRAKVNRYVREKDTDMSEVRADLKTYIKKIMPRDGKDGADADNKAILKDLKQYVNFNKEAFRGLKGDTVQPKDGKDGNDGVGIKDIYELKNYLHIELTNGKTKKFKIPNSKTIYTGGSSATNNLTDGQLQKIEDSITSTSVDTLTNKTLQDLTNKIDANQLVRTPINKSGATLLKGQLVQTNGVNIGTGDIQVELYDGTRPALGVVLEDTLDNEIVRVAVYGNLQGIDTSGQDETTLVYASPTNGSYTFIKPNVPNPQVIGLVVRVNANTGVICVCVDQPLADSDDIYYDVTRSIKDIIDELVENSISANENGVVLINTETELPNATVVHKLQVNGIVLHDTIWKDLITEFIPASGRAINEPSWEDIGNGIVLSRWDNGEELPIAYHVNHDYAQGTNAYPHIHFLSDSTEELGTTVTWRFAYVIAKGHQQGQSLTAPTTAIDITYTYTGAEVAGEHIVLEADDLQAFNLIEPDTVILAKVTMVNTNTVGRIFGIQADLHYQADREGTSQKKPDFNA